LNGDIVHFPVPGNLFARLYSSTASGKPEFGCDLGIDKGLKNFRNRFANEHFSSGNWFFG
jgi:hypothetical protein